MPYAIRNEWRITGMTGNEAASQAQGLRDSAAALLQEAALTSDPVQRDALTLQALAQINAARHLLDPAAPLLPHQPSTRLH